MRALLVSADVFTSLLMTTPVLAFWGKPSEEQWAGYRQCISDLRKEVSDYNTAIVNARAKAIATGKIFIGVEKSVSDYDKEECANDFGIER